MLGILIGFVAFALLVLTVFFWFMFTLSEHRIANAYRKLHAAGNVGSTPQSGWNIKYKSGRATKTITVQGATEAEALKNFVTTASEPYTSILSMEKF